MKQALKDVFGCLLCSGATGNMRMCKKPPKPLRIRVSWTIEYQILKFMIFSKHRLLKNMLVLYKQFLLNKNLKR